MPIHDWTRVSADTWHAFHLGWIAELQIALNDGRMPPDYYAQAEQVIGPFGPDVLTLQAQQGTNGEASPLEPSEGGGLAVASAPPRAKLISEIESDIYASKKRKLVIRHNSDDRIIALIELISPGNKSSRVAFRDFVDKAVECLRRGYHLLIVDLFPPSRRDPNGIHAAIWSDFTDTAFELPAEAQLTLVAYSAGETKKAYLESVAVGRELIEMPLFLEPDIYVNVPLEETYTAAFRGMPRKWRDVLERP